MTEDHPKVNFGKTGVLLINLGNTGLTNLWLDIRKYLKEFLSDRRVIETNLFCQIILNVFILNLRPSKTAKAYKEI